MKPPSHPIDKVLRSLDWRRAELKDLKGESQKLAVRIVFRAVPRVRSQRQVLMAVDVNVWSQGEAVRIELASPNIPPILQRMVMPMIIQGLMGVTPHSVGLTPCSHEPWHWNPFSLPLVWQQPMNDRRVFERFAQAYAELLKEKSWQCPDAAQLIQSMS